MNHNCYRFSNPVIIICRVTECLLPQLNLYILHPLCHTRKTSGLLPTPTYYSIQSPDLALVALVTAEYCSKHLTCRIIYTMWEFSPCPHSTFLCVSPTEPLSKSPYAAERRFFVCCRVNLNAKSPSARSKKSCSYMFQPEFYNLLQ
jgi:hypothetical protein